MAKLPEASVVLDKQLPTETLLPTHVHATDSVTLILDGELTERFEGRPIRCPRWKVLFKRANLPHTTESGRDGVRMLILTRRTGRATGDPPTLFPAGALSARLLRLFPLTDGTGRAPHVRDDALNALNARLSERPDAPGWVLETKHRIVHAGAGSPSLSALASSVFVHPVHLARVFRAHVGCSVGTFVRRCRVDAAVARLIDSDIPLSHLALSLGYYDQSHFSRQFLEETGWTPARFRRAVRRLQGEP